MAEDNDLIAAIYYCIVDPAGWEEVVTRIVEASGSHSGVLITLSPGALHLNTCRIEPFYSDAYVRHYHKINPLAAAPATNPSPGEVRAGTQVTQTEPIKASAFYNEFALPQGWSATIGIGLLRSPQTYQILTLQRSPAAIWVEEPEWHLLETIAPHLKRAAELHQLLSRARAMTDSLGTAVSAAGFAVFLLTGNCQVVFANPKAEDLLRRGTALRYERGRLAAATSFLTQRLRALARDAARPGRREGEIGGTLELTRGENCPPLIAHVIPLAANRGGGIVGFERPAALFVIDPAAGFEPQLERFAARFGLTPAETRVLREIADGKGLQAAAAQLNITPATAHTHAIRIFAKTGTSRQTELIRRFFEASLPGSPGRP